jgi:rhodanese-related sulfurtransferase
MKTTMCALWLAVSVAIPSTLTHALSATNQQTVASTRRFKTGDKQLREMAITSPAPEYPRTSLTKRVTGVVVAAVLFDEKGATEAVEIVQSPDAETGHAVRDAVMQWKIRPMMSMAGRGTLAFYFHMKGRDGVVLSPEEMRALTNPNAKKVKREDEPPVKHITAAEFRALSTHSNTLLLDIRDRETFGDGHEKGAVNIPFEEVLMRGPAELLVSRHIVIDCRDPLEMCAMSVHWLVSEGFAQVSILRR